jgi:hypothetical protein
MAYYTSPSIVLSDSGVGIHEVRQYQRGTLTFDAALKFLCEGYRQWQHDEGCKQYFCELTERLKSIHALRMGDWGRTSAELAELMIHAAEAPANAVAELVTRRNAEDDAPFGAAFVADHTYPDAIERGYCVAGDCVCRIAMHWVLRQGANGEWAEMMTFLGLVGGYAYWQRGPIHTLKVV